MKMEELKIISKSNLLGKEIDVYGTAEEPLFRASDVAEWIGHTDVNTMLKVVDEDEKLTQTIFGLGQRRNVWMLTEDGLYEVLMQSRKPIAKQFKKGVKEILKSIRKTGCYTAQPKPKDKVDAGLAWVEGCRRLLSLSDASTLLLMEAVARPLGLPLPDYVPSKGVTHSASELLKRHGVKMSAVKFNERLVELGFLKEETRQGQNKTHRFKVITGRGLEYGENVVSPKSQKETQPHWYDERFAELLGFTALNIKKQA